MFCYDTGTVIASAKRWEMQEAQSGAIIAIERKRVEQFVFAIGFVALHAPAIELHRHTLQIVFPRHERRAYGKYVFP